MFQSNKMFLLCFFLLTKPPQACYCVLDLSLFSRYGSFVHNFILIQILSTASLFLQILILSEILRYFLQILRYLSEKAV